MFRYVIGAYLPEQCDRPGQQGVGVNVQVLPDGAYGSEVSRDLVPARISSAVFSVSGQALRLRGSRLLTICSNVSRADRGCGPVSE